MTVATPFRIVALHDGIVASLFPLNDGIVALPRLRRMVVDTKPGYPCRVSLVDADIGEEVLLISYAHHAVDSPYRASGPIFVRTGASQAKPAPGEIPEFLRSRLLSIRAYDGLGALVAADVAEGGELESRCEPLFANPRIRYLHLHNARLGCFLCRADRVA